MERPQTLSDPTPGRRTECVYTATRERGATGRLRQRRTPGLIMDTSATTEVNVNTTLTTRSPQEILYRSSGAIVAIIVIGIILIFTLVLFLLKYYNRQNRLKRDLAPKSSKQHSLPALQTNIPVSRPTSLVSVSSNIPLERKF